MTFIRLRGSGVSPGIGMGEIALTDAALLPARKETIPASGVDGELRRLKRAVDRTKVELLQLKQLVKDNMGEEHAFIFDAHRLILEDNEGAQFVIKNPNATTTCGCGSSLSA